MTIKNHQQKTRIPRWRGGMGRGGKRWYSHARHRLVTTFTEGGRTLDHCTVFRLDDTSGRPSTHQLTTNSTCSCPFCTHETWHNRMASNNMEWITSTRSRAVKGDRQHICVAIPSCQIHRVSWKKVKISYLFLLLWCGWMRWGGWMETLILWTGWGPRWGRKAPAPLRRSGLGSCPRKAEAAERCLALRRRPRCRWRSRPPDRSGPRSDQHQDAGSSWWVGGGKKGKYRHHNGLSLW